MHCNTLPITPWTLQYHIMLKQYTATHYTLQLYKTLFFTTHYSHSILHTTILQLTALLHSRTHCSYTTLISYTTHCIHTTLHTPRSRYTLNFYNTCIHIAYVYKTLSSLQSQNALHSHSSFATHYIHKTHYTLLQHIAFTLHIAHLHTYKNASSLISRLQSTSLGVHCYI